MAETKSEGCGVVLLLALEGIDAAPGLVASDFGRVRPDQGILGKLILGCRGRYRRSPKWLVIAAFFGLNGLLWRRRVSASSPTGGLRRVGVLSNSLDEEGVAGEVV